MERTIQPWTILPVVLGASVGGQRLGQPRQVGGVARVDEEVLGEGAAPWAVAAAPPTMMKSTPASTRARRSPG